MHNQALTSFIMRDHPPPLCFTMCNGCWKNEAGEREGECLPINCTDCLTFLPSFLSVLRPQPSSDAGFLPLPPSASAAAADQLPASSSAAPSSATAPAAKSSTSDLAIHCQPTPAAALLPAVPRDGIRMCCVILINVIGTKLAVVECHNNVQSFSYPLTWEANKKHDFLIPGKAATRCPPRPPTSRSPRTPPRRSRGRRSRPWCWRRSALPRTRPTAPRSQTRRTCSFTAVRFVQLLRLPFSHVIYFVFVVYNRNQPSYVHASKS